jgi:hypothetical protein
MPKPCPEPLLQIQIDKFKFAKTILNKVLSSGLGVEGFGFKVEGLRFKV